MNFTNPLDVSVGLLSDRLRIEIINKVISDEVLFSEDLNQALDEQYHNLTKSIPRQTANNVATRSTVETASHSGLLSKILFIIALLLSLIFGGALEYMSQYIKVMQLAFHLPLLRIKFQSLPLILISQMIPLVMVDILENPWDKDITSIISFSEYPQELIDSNVDTQWQMINYETTNYIQNIQSILLMVLYLFLKLIIICFLQLLINITKDNKKIKEFKK